jgi:hypothetical protein
MRQSCDTRATAARADAPPCAVGRRDAYAYAGDLHALRRELQDPPEFMPGEPVHAAGTGRERAIHHDVALWFG